MYLQKEEELCLTHLCLIKDTNKQLREQHCTLCGNYEDGPHMVCWCPEAKPFFFSIWGLTRDCSERVGNLIYGIAQYALYLNNVHSRLHNTIRSPSTIKSRFRGLMTYYYNISRPDIQQG